MPSSTPTARLVGGLLLLQLTGLILPFVLLQRLVEPDYLAVAAGKATQLHLAVGLLFLNGLVTIAISAVLWPVVRPLSEVGAVLLLAASAIMFCLQAVDNAHLLAMLSLSQQSIAGGSPGELLDVVGTTLRSTRRGVHYAELFSIELWMGLLYGVLLRVRAVPRALGLAGLITVALHFIGVVLPFYAGYASMMLLAPLMGLSQLALVGRISLAGFDTPVRPPG